MRSKILLLYAAGFLGSISAPAQVAPEGSSTAAVHLLLMATNAAAAPEPPAQTPWVMGYYLGYQHDLQAPSNVDYSAMTHIAVGAAIPLADGRLTTHFYINDTDGPAWARDTIARAHAAGSRALLMIGGSGETNITGFRATRDPAVRAAFVANLANLVADYQFDGIDLDWEPILIGSNPDTDDRNILLALAQAIRAALPGKTMTIPVGWNNANLDNMNHPFYGQLAALFDRVNLMTYHMNGCGYGWQSWHSSPLFGETPSTPSSISNSVKILIKSGVPIAKIGIGMAFSGQAYENGTWQGNLFVHRSTPPYVTAPRQATDQAAVRMADNWVSYSLIMRYYHEPSACRWDAVARHPYLTFPTPKTIPVPEWATPPLQTTYVTYEDEQSIAEKGAFLRRQKLGGIIIWDISNGFLNWKSEGEKDPLMKAVKSSLRGIP